MSTTIDERVVEMRFDNKQFESNVSTSMSTLKKLKESLKFTGATKGLEEIDAASKRVNMSGLGGAVDSVKAKFSALDVVAVTALANITNSAVNTGKRLIAALSVDQISAGWQKFSDKTVSSATLVAQGYAIEDVNRQLSLLNWFTDETSYNFTEMVANIAKFTATGKGLEESVVAMEGIATWAALSGQNAMTASRAMYQLSQAMGAGVMRREDYRSIQNASMDTKEFRQNCLDAAVALGTLKDNGDGTYTSIVEGAKQSTFTISQFADNLTEGMWLTSDVMMAVYTDYASAVNAIYEAVDERGFDTASEVIDEIRTKAKQLKTEAMTDEEAIDAAIKELGYTLEDGSLKFDHFGLKAFEAAQKARTFTDVLDSVKDAVSTGWMNTFEKIFGDAEGATELFTMMANELWTTFAGGSERRNSILDKAMTSGWEKLTNRIKDAGIETDVFESKVREVAKAGGVDIDSLISKYGSLSDVFKNGALDTDYLKKALSGLGDTVTEVTGGLSVDLSDILPGKYGETVIAWGSDATESVRKIQTALTELKYDLSYFGVDGKFGNETQAAVAAFQKDAGLNVTGRVDQATLDALAEAGKSLQTISESSGEASVNIDDLIESLSRPSGRELVFDIISNSLGVINGLLGAFRDAWADVFSEERVASGIYGVLKSIRDFTEGLFELDEDGSKVLKNFDKIKNTLQGVISVFDVLVSIAGGAVKFAFKALGVVFGGFNLDILGATSSIGEFLTKLAETIKEGEYIGKAFDWLLVKFKSGVKWIKDWISNLLAPIKEIPFVKETTEALNNLAEAFDSFKKGESTLFDFGIAVKNTASRILNAIPGFTKWLETFEQTETFKKWTSALSEFQAVVQKFRDGDIGFEELLKGIGELISKALMSIPIIEKWANSFEEWFTTFKETPSVQKLVGAINAIVDAFTKLKNGELSFEDFGSILGENLGKAISALPEVIKGAANGVVEGAKQIASDFIQGFQNGIAEKVGNVISSIVNFCTNFVAAFKEALGIHSPSWISFEAAIDWFRGLINGIKAAIGKVLSSISDVGSKIVGAFDAVWGKLIEIAGKIDWGRLFAGGSIAALIYSAVTISNAISRISKAISGIGDLITSAKKVLDNFGKVLKSFSKVLDGISWDFKAKALLKMAIAIGILAAAVWIIAQIPRENLISSVIVVGVLAGVLVALGFAMSKMGQASVDLKNKSADIKGLNTVLLQIAIAIIAVAAAIKILGSMNPDQLKQGILTVAGAVVGILAAAAIFGLISKYAEPMDDFGNVLLKMAAALLIMTYVVKIIGGMDPGELIVGSAFLILFSGVMVGLMAATRLIGNSGNVENIGLTLIKIAAALLIMAYVAKIVGGMDPGELIVGTAIMILFSGLIVGLMAATKLIGNSGNVENIGGVILKIAAALALMALVVRALGGMDPEELKRGEKAVGYFAALVVGLMAATRLIGDGGNVEHIGKALLGVSGAIAIIAGIAILLSFMSWESFVKGAVMVTAFAGIMVGLMAATKLIGSSGQIATVGKTLMMVSGAIAILAGIAVLLGIVPTENLVKGVAAITVLGLVMAVLIAVTSKAQKCIGTLVVLGLVVAAMGGIVIALANLTDPNKAVVAALILAGLMAAMALVIFALGSLGPVSATALIGVVAMAALAAVLYGLTYLLASMDGLKNANANVLILIALAAACVAMVAVLSLLGIGALASLVGVAALFVLTFALKKLVDVLVSMEGLENARSNAISLSILAGACSLMLIPLAIAGALALPAIAGVGALYLLSIVLGQFVSVLSSMEGLTNAEANALILISLMETLGNILVKISLLGPLAIIGEAAVLGLVSLIGVIGTMAVAVGALMEKFPQLQQFLDTGIPVLEQLSEGIGTMIGKLVGGIISGIGSAIIGLLPQLGMALGMFMAGATPFIVGAKQVDASVVAGAGFLAAAIIALTAAEFRSAMASICTGGQASFSQLGSQLNTFADDALSFSEKISDVDQGAVESASSIAKMIIALTAGEMIDGIGKLFGLTGDFSSIGTKLEDFGEAAVKFSENITGKIDSGAIQAASDVGELFVTLTDSLPKSGGLIQELLGEKDLSKFSEGISDFADCLIKVNETLSQDGLTIQSDKIDQLAEAGTKFSDLVNSLPKSEGFVQDFLGSKDLGKFGTAVSDFADCLIEVNGALNQEGFTIQSDKFDQLAKAGSKFSDLINSLPKNEGTFPEFIGKQDLGKFGSAVKEFANCMIEVNSDISQEGFAVNLEGIENLKLAGEKMNELQSSLPKAGGWWQDVAGSSDIGDFGEKIQTFASAISDFSAEATGFDIGAIELAISTSYKIKDLLTSLVGMDYSGVASFTGVGYGGIGADGPLYEVGMAISKFSESLDGINTENIPVAVEAATKLKTLISNLVGLDTSGVDNFNPETIGVKMKAYSDNVLGLDSGVVEASISSANRLKNLISGLAELDSSGAENFRPEVIGAAISGYNTSITGIDTETISSSIGLASRLRMFISSLSGIDSSGVENFDIGPIGDSLKSYGSSVSALDAGKISTSISVANKVKDFISGLSGLNTSGVAAFKAAIEELSHINLKSFMDSFGGVSFEQVASLGIEFINSLSAGISEGSPKIDLAIADILTKAITKMKSRAPEFKRLGANLVMNMSSGMLSKKSLIGTNAYSAAYAAVQRVRDNYWRMEEAGKYLAMGLANGIELKRAIVEDIAYKLGEKAAKAAKEALGEQSPSKVFMEIGAYASEGLAIGIESLSGRVENASTGIADIASANARGAILSVLDAINSDIDVQPTIRPIVDLTDVKTGVAAVSGMFGDIQTTGIRSNLNAIRFVMNDKLQNGANDDVVSAIDKLSEGLKNNRGNTYHFGDFTYDDGSNVANAVGELIRYARIGRRV